MRIKIKRQTVVCGGSLQAFHYRKALKKLEGRWVPVETEYIFQDQYNTGPEWGDLRVMGENVEKIDYEKDDILRVVHTAMRAGKIKCHSYRHDKLEFVDLYQESVPTDVFTALFKIAC